MSVALAFLIFLIIGWLWTRLNNSLLKGDFFSPLNLLFYCWILPFMLSLTNMSGLQSGVKANAIIVIALCTIALFATCMIPALFVGRKSYPKVIDKYQRRVRVNVGGVLFFYFLTLVAVYFAEFSDRNIPLFAYLIDGSTESNLHAAGKESKLQVLAFGIHAASIVVFYLFLNETRLFRRIFYLFLSAFVVFIGIMKASKTDIIIPILSFSALIYYHQRFLQPYNPSGSSPFNISSSRFYAILTVLFMSVLFSIVTSIRLEGVGYDIGYADLIEFRYINEFGEYPSEVLSLLYGYSALGFQNFSNYINSHEVSLRIGTSLFRPVLSALMMGEVADSMTVPVDARNVVSGAANTGTYLTPLYIEGGFFICLLGSLCYGLVVNTAYYLAFRTRCNIGWFFAYVSLLFPWIWLFFTNAFSVLSIYINVIYVIILGLFFAKRYPDVDQPRGGNPEYRSSTPNALSG